MAISRVKTWISGEVLTASDLNNEFNNILNNATGLISPLTANLAFGGFSLTGLGAGSTSTPSLSFTGDTNTGLYSSAAESVDIVGQGGRIIQASGFADAVNFVRVTNSITGQAPAVEAVGTDTNVGLRLVAKGSGYVEATAFRFGVFTATQSADHDGRAYWHKTEGTLHIVSGTLMARIPAIPSIQRGDLIHASGTDGATTFARLGIGTTGQVLVADGGVPIWAASESLTIKWVKFNGSGGILSSSGVSNVAREAAGEYRIDWTTPYASTAYAVTATGGGSTEQYVKTSSGTAYATTHVRVSARNQNGTADDAVSGVITVMATE